MRRNSPHRASRALGALVVAFALLAVPGLAWSQTTGTTAPGPTTSTTSAVIIDWICHNPDGSIRFCTREEAEAELRRGPTTSTTTVVMVDWVCHNPDGSIRFCTREEAEAELRRGPTTSTTSTTSTTTPRRADPAQPRRAPLALTG